MAPAAVMRALMGTAKLLLTTVINLLAVVKLFAEHPSQNIT